MDRDISIININAPELAVLFALEATFRQIGRYNRGEWPAEYAAIAGHVANRQRLVILEETTT